ncbi:MAG: aspartate-semialdehyde dehydrogenase [Cryomorphaceae bacterium]|nr:aspartate-semialdehyde dehydrogenase [Cryomorphaceae bacterium]
MKVAVVGATGMVGRTMLKVLEERNFPISMLLPVASERSVGSTVRFNEADVNVVSMEEAIAQKPDLALFSAGGDTSLQWAPKFAEVGCTVIDNSSAWRMHADKKLIVPEVNGAAIGASDLIIANPNCSTIQLVMTLKPLHDAFGAKRVIVSTYQSVSGTGKEAIDQMEMERKGVDGKMVYPYPIDRNCLPQCDVFTDNDYTKEEMKLTNETCKILGDKSVHVVATAVRVPVTGGHSESVNVEFEKAFEVDEVKRLLANFPGIRVQDQPELKMYPMPLYAAGKDEVFVGRIRRDFTRENTLNMWIVSDNLRKGAATNAVQIAEYLLANGRW